MQSVEIKNLGTNFEIIYVQSEHPKIHINILKHSYGPQHTDISLSLAFEIAPLV